MAWLSAYLPADTAAGIWDRTSAAARALQGPAEHRTLAQLRADVAATWFLTAGNAADGADVADRVDGALAVSRRAGDVPSPAAQVLVTVPVFSLLGLTEEPAILDGYGPIPPSMARRLVADGAASLRRVLTDPRDGAPLEIGRSTTGSQKPCGNGSGSATADAPSPAATTTPWTTRPTTSWPGPTAAPPASATSASPAANTTASNTPQPGHPAGATRRQTTRLDLTCRTQLPQRTTGLGTTRLAGPNGPDGPAGQPRGLSGLGPATACEPPTGGSPARLGGIHSGLGSTPPWLLLSPWWTGHRCGGRAAAGYPRQLRAHPGGPAPRGPAPESLRRTYGSELWPETR